MIYLHVVYDVLALLERTDNCSIAANAFKPKIDSKGCSNELNPCISNHSVTVAIVAWHFMAA